MITENKFSDYIRLICAKLIPVALSREADKFNEGKK
jgi:hypothetical protein